MPFPFHINILDLLLKGVAIGILVSAPMGPVGVLCVQRTLNKGRWFGFVTGIGACVSDFIYALITGLGMSFVMDFISNSHYRYILQISASIILMIFGIYSFRSNPMKKVHVSNRGTKGSLIHNCITAFLVTFSNPLIIMLMMGLFAQFAFIIPNHPVEMCAGYIGIIGGAMLWWYGLTWLVDKIRAVFDTNGIQIINKVVGSIVIVMSIIVLIVTVFNLYTLPTINY